jgi:hypothetical protein
MAAVETQTGVGLQLDLCQHCVMAAAWVSRKVNSVLARQPLKGLKSGLAFIPRREYPKFSCFLSPNLRKYGPSDIALQACSSVTVFFTNEHAENFRARFILVHDSLQRCFFLPDASLAGSQHVWSLKPQDAVAAVPTQLQDFVWLWTYVSFRVPLMCCSRGAEVTWSVLQRASELQLRDCRLVQLLAKCQAGGMDLRSCSRKMLCAKLRSMRTNKPTCDLQAIHLMYPTAKLILLKPLDKQSTCALCGSGFNFSRLMVTLPCGHRFHADWRCSIGSACGATCPACLGSSGDLGVEAALEGLNALLTSSGPKSRKRRSERILNEAKRLKQSQSHDLFSALVNVVGEEMVAIKKSQT